MCEAAARQAGLLPASPLIPLPEAAGQWLLALFVLHRPLSTVGRSSHFSLPPLQLAHPLASRACGLHILCICTLCQSVLPAKQLQAGAHGCSCGQPHGPGPLWPVAPVLAVLPLGDRRRPQSQRTKEKYPPLTYLCYLRRPELFVPSPLYDKGSKLL